jgi:TonB family protein
VTLPVWLSNLIAYSLQISLLAAVGTLLAYLFRLRLPRVMHLYWQLLLLVCLLLPCFQKWNHPILSRGIVVTESLETPAIPISEMELPSIPKPEKLILWKYIPHILFTVILLRLLWLGIGFFRLRLFCQKSQPLSDECTVIQDMQLYTGVRVTVLISSAIHSPATFGFRSPTILLPLSFKELSEPCKQAVLCHELMHVRRCDWIVILIEEVIRSLFWFHPAIWWLLNRVQLSREQTVDYEVVRLTGVKQPYLDSLLEFAQKHQRMKAVPAPLFLREQHLVQRVALLLKEVSMSRTRLFFSMSGITALLVTSLYFFTVWFPLTGNPVYAQEETQSPVTKQLLTGNPAYVQAQAQTQTPATKQSERNSLAPVQQQIAALMPAIAPVMAPVAAQPQESQSEMKLNPIRVGANIMASRLIYKVAPEYPEIAKRMRISGPVMLMANINEEGLVSDVQVISGNTILIDTAIKAVKQWRYSPTLLNGMPVPVVTPVTVVFNLGNSDDLSVFMDNSGNLNAELNQMVQTKGTVHLMIMQGTPYKIADSVVQNLLQQGLQRLDVWGFYVLYQNHLYYAGPDARPVNEQEDTIMKAVLAVMNNASSSETNANREPTIRFNYRIFISETGEVEGLQRLGGDEFPGFEAAVLRSRVSTMQLNGEPIPYARTVTRFR